jgi:hypothetical protein
MLFGQSHDLRDRQGFVDLMALNREFVSQCIRYLGSEQEESYRPGSIILPFNGPETIFLAFSIA